MADLQRRVVLQGGVLGLAGLLTQGCSSAAPTGVALLGFTPVPVSQQDRITLPPEYRHEVLYRWGDPTGLAAGQPAFRADASNSAAEQALQAGMHHDGMHFFPLAGSADRALLVLNHEYTDEQLLHRDGVAVWSAEKVRKSQHAMGVSVIELRRTPAGSWQQVLPSPLARRIHANTPMAIGGPAAGHRLLQTALDPSGRQVLGTLANCAMGVTPWGTYLTCEENFQGYFGAERKTAPAPDATQKRYGTLAGEQWVDWYRFDERFDLARHPHEANRFGWVVEIDPMDPHSTPIKRTALGRKRHESATCRLCADGRVAIYMGDDARFEYLYKFISARPVQPGGAAANHDLLDHGTLYAARLDADGRGQWLPLVQGQGGLDAASGFASQAEVLVKARLAADRLGATALDRPEWVAVHPQTGEVFFTLTNNTRRGDHGRPPVEPASPRGPNPFGHITRLREAGADAGALQFNWAHFVLAGDPAVPGAGTQYPHPQADIFGSPDGLQFDASGLLWIQTDMAGQDIGHGPNARLGNNAMLCADLASGRIQRFMTGPNGCEITGCVLSPDRRSLFVNIQHPGEASEFGERPHNSAWPDGQTPGSARPRSATVLVQRRDGGIIGT